MYLEAKEEAISDRKIAKPSKTLFEMVGRLRQLENTKT